MNFEEYKRYTGSHTLVPVYRTILADEITPVSAYLRLRGKYSGSFLFESVEGGDTIARYSFIGFDPDIVLTTRDGMTTISGNGTAKTAGNDLFQTIKDLTSSWNPAPIQCLPRFTGGLVGFIGYDTVRFIERIPCTVENSANLPDAVLGLFRNVIVFDHLRHQCTIVVYPDNSRTADARELFDSALARISELENILFHPADTRMSFNNPAAGETTQIRNEMTEEEYSQMVVRAKDYIRCGDIFQTVLSQRFSVPYDGDHFSVYRALRIINPSPYHYYLDIGGCTVIGSSPEILVRMENGKAEVYPIAGTRPRGAGPEEDQALGKELLADEKERSEHVMLVDLGRNDLGRVCLPGSVRIDPFMNIVRYSHVMHIASRVTGLVRPGTHPVDVFTAAFPAGTVTGAPKIRAMEIIDTLEKTRRCLYAGGVGYFDFSGNMDFCIAIRTIVSPGGRLYFQAGAGIVADSVPHREYEETMNKARVLIEAITFAERIGR